MSHRSNRLRPWAGRALAAALLLAAGAASAQTHADNPFVGARPYVNPDYTAQAETSAGAATDPALAAAMRQVGATPTAVWLDTISQVGLMTTHLDRALAAGQDLVIFVLHDLPGRGCDAAELSELQLNDQGLATYRSQFIDAAAAIARQPRYAGVRIVFVVEPGALASLITGLSVPCTVGAGPSIYMQSLQYAVDTLHAIPNAYVYLDLAHAARLGWTESASRMVTLLGQVSSGFAAGKGAVDGFVTNVGEYVPTQEPYLTAHQTVGANQVWTSTFYDYDPMLDDATYAADMYARLVTAGWPAGIGMLSDTSRNGWGGPLRPTGPSSATSDVDAFVNGSKVDRRADRTLWCNPAGAGIGQRPQAAPVDFPAAHYDAYVWVRSPGLSDGASLNVYDGPWYNRMCDPTYTTPQGVPTGALPDAPPAGRWFPAQFTQLVQNAWPPFSSEGVMTLTVVKSGVGSGTITSSPSGISCGATCSAGFAAGTVITLTAVAPAPYTFVGWSGPCTGTSPTCVVTMTQANTVAAAFSGQAVQLTVGWTQGGRVTSSPAGGSYPAGTVVTLTAVATSPAVFSSWVGACSGQSPTCVVTMTESKSVTAIFVGAPQPQLTVTFAGRGTGTVVSTSGAVQCGATCSLGITYGASLVLTAVPAEGSVFAGWSGDCAGTGTCSAQMIADRNITATFNGPDPTLTVTRAGAGGGTITSTPSGISCGATCTSRYLPSMVVTLTATPSAGSVFLGWSGGCTGTAATCTVTMPGELNVSVTGTFGLAPATPCANPITFTNNTGNFNTTRAACYRTTQRVNGWGCANFQGRKMSVNGGAATSTCGAGPFPLAKLADGYTYFSATAGTYPWASIYIW
jgi:cellulose 1,4-beta-cellobiosidase